MTRKPDRAWVLLKSGKRLDLLNPHPMAWDDEDLATGLARTYRWGGHSKWELPLSVAQHSLTVLLLRMRQAPVRLTASSTTFRSSTASPAGCAPRSSRVSCDRAGRASRTTSMRWSCFDSF